MVTDCLLKFIQIKITIQKSIKLKDIYQEVFSRTITSSSIEQISMTDTLILTWSNIKK